MKERSKGMEHEVRKEPSGFEDASEIWARRGPDEVGKVEGWKGECELRDTSPSV